MICGQLSFRAHTDTLFMRPMMLLRRRILAPGSSRESGELSSHGQAGTRCAADWISAHSEKAWGSVALGKLQKGQQASVALASQQPRGLI